MNVIIRKHSKLLNSRAMMTANQQNISWVLQGYSPLCVCFISINGLKDMKVAPLFCVASTLQPTASILSLFDKTKLLVRSNYNREYENKNIPRDKK